jgi:nucleotide-binding universal stress UspA family protein
MLMGSVAEEVVRRSDRPVLVVHQEEEETPPAMAPPDVSSLLVPVDFSEHAREALRHAAALGALYDASLNLLHVVEDALPSAFYVGGVQSIYDVEPDLDDKAREALQTFVEKAGVPDAVETSVHVASGRAADVIAEQSEALESGMVVMSTHGNTGAENYLLGSVAEKVVRRARCPVFTVRAFGQSILQSAT